METADLGLSKDLYIMSGGPNKKKMSFFQNQGKQFVNWLCLETVEGSRLVQREVQNGGDYTEESRVSEGANHEGGVKWTSNGKLLRSIVEEV